VATKKTRKKQSGGGYWEAMHGDMGGFHEIRLNLEISMKRRFPAWSRRDCSLRRSEPDDDHDRSVVERVAPFPRGA
jgi:hypothetical protein